MPEVLHIKDWKDAYVHRVNALEVADAAWAKGPQINSPSDDVFEPERRQVTALSAMELLNKRLPPRGTMLTP